GGVTGVADEVVDDGVDQSADGVPGCQGGVGLRIVENAHALGHRFEGRPIELVLGAEVVVYQLLGDPGLPGDVLDIGRFKAPGGEFPLGGLDDSLQCVSLVSLRAHSGPPRCISRAMVAGRDPVATTASGEGFADIPFPGNSRRRGLAPWRETPGPCPYNAPLVSQADCP